MQRPFTDLFVCSRHGADDASHVAPLLWCGQGLVLDVSTVVRRSDIEIISCEDGHHTGNHSRFIGIDATYARMRNGAAKDLRMGHTRQLDVARIQGSTRDLLC